MASLASYQGTLGQKKASHLLRRTCFRYTKQQVDQLATMNVDQATSSLLTLNPLGLDQPIYDDTSTPAVEQVQWLLPAGQAFPTTDTYIPVLSLIHISQSRLRFCLSSVPIDSWYRLTLDVFALLWSSHSKYYVC